MLRNPGQHGFIMPAEWEQQAAIWLAWPHQIADWPDKFEPIPWVWAEIIRVISEHQKVNLLVQDKKQEKIAAKCLQRGGATLENITYYHIPTDRVWMRDAGPIFVTHKSGHKALLDFQFNAWAKYKNHKNDNQIPELIAKIDDYERVEVTHLNRHVVLEGGSIDVNGKGTLITTEECLLSKVQCRNPKFTREDYETVFANYLGVTNVIWLDRGIVGDDTHGHVDDITRFVAPSTVVTVVEKNKSDANYDLLQENLKRLKAAKDQNGKELDIIELPMPKPVTFEGERLPASYANFLICNQSVLVPVFNDANDRVALNLLAECFPKRDIVPIAARDLIWGLGTIHCLSQQEPV